MLIVPASNITALLLLRNTWLLAVGLGVARRIQLRQYAGALFSLVVWLGVFYLFANLFGASAQYGTISRSLAEAILSFSASRSLLQLLRLRMDHFRLVGQTGRVAAILVTATMLAPLAALGSGVSSLFRNTIASTAARALTAAEPATASPPVTLSTCANLVGRCGCAAKTAFHRGETVNLLAVSSAMPRLDVQVELTGQPSTRVNLSSWRSSGARRCAAGQYKIPADAQDGFSHVHLLVNPGAPNQARSETGFSVLP